jgi:hypothetical protein
MIVPGGFRWVTPGPMYVCLLLHSVLIGSWTRGGAVLGSLTSRRHAIAGRAQDLAGGTLVMSGSGDASTPPATGTELSRLPSNRPDPKADHDKGPSPAAGYVGVCYIQVSVTMVHHC